MGCEGREPSVRLCRYSACKFEEGDTLAEAEVKTIKEYQAKAGLCAMLALKDPAPLEKMLS